MFPPHAYTATPRLASAPRTEICLARPCLSIPRGVLVFPACPVQLLGCCKVASAVTLTDFFHLLAYPSAQFHSALSGRCISKVEPSRIFSSAPDALWKRSNLELGKGTCFSYPTTTTSTVVALLVIALPAGFQLHNVMQRLSCPLS